MVEHIEEGNMQDGDTSLDGFDETETSEKSVIGDVRGDSGNCRRWKRTCI